MVTCLMRGCLLLDPKRRDLKDLAFLEGSGQRGKRFGGSRPFSPSSFKPSLFDIHNTQHTSLAHYWMLRRTMSTLPSNPAAAAASSLSSAAPTSSSSFPPSPTKKVYPRGQNPGLRYIEPYYYPYKTYAKGRWLGRELVRRSSFVVLSLTFGCSTGSRLRSRAELSSFCVPLLPLLQLEVVSTEFRDRCDRALL